MQNKNDDGDQSGFLEAPFVRMLRMRSASLKIITFSYCAWSSTENSFACFIAIIIVEVLPEK